MRIPRLTLVLAATMAFAACASGGMSGTGAKREAATVLVDNQGLLDMTIYVLRGSQRVRLGLATALNKTRFTIPTGLVFGSTQLRFLADPVGSSRTPVSEEVSVSEGDEIELRIPPG